MKDTILEVKDLITTFKVDEGKFRAVDEVNFTVEKGRSLGIVGESGCGKSITAMSIMRLIEKHNGTIESGQVIFNGKDLLKLREIDMNVIRGNEISMIFQEPMIALNPVLKIGNQIGEMLKIHKNITGKENKNRVLEMLKLVGIKKENEIINSYPHQLSGGMCQRVMIAMALSCSPKLLIADEPTTALDVTIQAQILDLINEVKEKLDMSVIFITHDLGVICEVADDVMVMYAGKVVEKASVKEIFDNPLHPYTIGLINSRPENFKRGERLKCIEGNVPKFSESSAGCEFLDRCFTSMDICKNSKPTLKGIKSGHEVRCFKYSE